jgi:3-hydroxyacyl-CoA dehydrogenase
VKAGRLGRKSGRGVYEYPETSSHSGQKTSQQETLVADPSVISI